MTRGIRSIECVDAGELARLLNEAFWGYFVQFEFTAESLGARMHFDGVDRERSKILEVDGDAAGLALIAPRPGRSRLATMGIRPEYRGQGLGREMLAELLRESAQQNEGQMVLEVIQRNVAAVALYESEGFVITRELFGFGLQSSGGGEAGALVEIAPEELAHAVAEHGEAEPPWQLSAPSLARLGSMARCFRLGPARVAIARAPGDEIRILALVCEREERRRGAATRLLHALYSEHPGQRWTVPAVCPAGSGTEFLTAMGFEMLELRQYEMIRTAAARSNRRTTER